MKSTEREKGKQFSSGKLTSGDFSRFITLASGEPYTDEFTRTQAKLKESREKTKKIAIGPCFKPVSPPKKMNGSGNTYGLFTQNMPHMPPNPPVQAIRGAKPASPRNFSVSPPKRGQGGIPGTLLSPYPPHMPAEYDSVHKVQMEEEAKARSKRQGPIRVGCKTNDMISTPAFDTEPTVQPKKYTMDRKVTKPFRPTSPGRRGVLGTFSNYPEHIPDPYDEHERRKRQEMHRKGVGEVPFKTSFATKTSPTRSIQFK